MRRGDLIRREVGGKGDEGCDAVQDIIDDRQALIAAALFKVCNLALEYHGIVILPQSPCSLRLCSHILVPHLLHGAYAHSSIIIRLSILILVNPPISFSRRPLAQDYCMSSDAANPTAKHASINGTAANTTNTASTIGGGGGSRMQDSFVYASKRDRRESPDRLSLRGRSSEVVRLRQSSGGGSTTGTGATKSKVSSYHSGKCRPASRSRKKSTKGADREVMLKLGKEERSVHALEAELEYVQEDRVQLMERYSRCKARCEELEQVHLS